MHMSDTLISTPVAAVAGIAAAALLVVAGSKLKKSNREGIVPLMGVMGAFVFAAQMINFSIPGTGSSGHIVGGVLLAAMLGPWAAFITLSSVLIIQCLVFADGGLMALGCNIINMAALSTLVAYPLIYRPLMRLSKSPWMTMGASMAACIFGLELGALAVTGETIASGVTALPATTFLMLMTSIHLAIGLGEGMATGAVLMFVAKERPGLLYESNRRMGKKKLRNACLWIAGIAIAVAGGLSLLASSNPDGLEWSIAKITGATELASESQSSVMAMAQKAQQTTAVLPDYEGYTAGIIGALIVLALLWVVSSRLLRPHKQKSNTLQ